MKLVVALICPGFARAASTKSRSVLYGLLARTVTAKGEL
jgi:hypothetical protein